MRRLLHLAHCLTFLVPLLHRFKATGLQFQAEIDVGSNCPEYEWQNLNFLWEEPEEEVAMKVGVWLEHASKSEEREADSPRT